MVSIFFRAPLKGTARVLLIGALMVLGRVIPRDPNLILFSQSKKRYSGNSRVLFETVTPDIVAFWLYEDVSVVDRAPANLKDRFVPLYSVRGFWLCFRAGQIVISHGSGDFGLFWHAVCNAQVTMLWHAIGIKCAGLMDNKLGNKRESKLLRNEVGWYNHIICSSDIDRYYTASYQGLTIGQVFVTGLPKADVYMMKRDQFLCEGRAGKDVKILYAPTFRDWDSPGRLWFPFDDFSIDSFDLFSRKNRGIRFYLRPHPNDVESIRCARDLQGKHPENIEVLSADVLDDIDEMLHEFDVIVTDYSSIYMEPLLRDVPVIFVAHDIETYLEKRGIAYPYELVTPGPKVTTFNEFLEALEDALAGAQEWKAHRFFVRSMFFKYQEVGACERVWALLNA